MHLVPEVLRLFEALKARHIAAHRKNQRVETPAALHFCVRRVLPGFAGFRQQVRWWQGETAAAATSYMCRVCSCARMHMSLFGTSWIDWTGN